MNVLIVLAHPEPDSLNGALARAAQETLSSLGHAVQISDLYAMNFDPVAGAGDVIHELAGGPFNLQLEQKAAHQNGTFEPDLKTEMDKLVWADLVIFQFPLWWFGLPAILKGWVDRVFAYGFAYGGGRWFDRGVFKGKRGLISVTIGGPATSYTASGLQGDLLAMLKPIWYGSFEFCGIAGLHPHAIHQADNRTREAMEDRIREFQTRLETIFDEEPILQVRLEDFDERMQRK